MQEVSKRHQLKRNELEDFVVKVITWVKNNNTTFFSVAAVVVGIAIFLLFFIARYRQTQKAVSDRLSMAQSQLYQGQTDQGIATLNDIINKFPTSPVAFEARLIKADHLIDAQNYPEAETTLLPVIKNGRPKNVIPLGMSLLGVVYENSQKYKEAIDLYKSFLDQYPSHFLTPKIYESLARVYEITGANDQAVPIYEKLAALYPETGWAKLANARLAALSGQSEKSK
jgi:TolA-binding protein